MVIGIDGNEANVTRRVGIGEYAYELLVEFYRLREEGDTNSHFQIYLKDAPLSDMPKATSWWEYVVVKPRKLWTQIGLPIYLFTHFPRPDIFFTPSHYAPRWSPVPTAIAIMDLSYIHFPRLFAKNDLYQLIQWTKYSARNATKIFTISNASKNDILKIYKKKDEDVLVTHLGIKHELSKMNNELSKKELEEKFGISSKYILFVGTLQPRKNITRLIEAFSLITHSHPKLDPGSSSSIHRNNDDSGQARMTKGLQLVVVGKKGWLYEDILAAPQKFGVEERVRFLDFVTDEELPSLYKYAEVFVLPSLYEGFGLPVLEAMKLGCPVITSKVSSLPEAGGDAALYINPEDTADIAEKIEKVLTDKDLRERMIKKGYEHAKQFSWEKTARKTLEVLEEVAKKGK